jgi:hypothetical protein
MNSIIDNQRDFTDFVFSDLLESDLQESQQKIFNQLMESTYPLWKDVYPTIVTKKGKPIITSTPNGQTFKLKTFWENLPEFLKETPNYKPLPIVWEQNPFKEKYFMGFDPANRDDKGSISVLLKTKEGWKDISPE